MEITLQFLKKHSNAFVCWELLNRASNDEIYEIPSDHFVDILGRDEGWLNNTISNARNRIKIDMLKSH
jgi:hypothetical protein